VSSHPRLQEPLPELTQLREVGAGSWRAAACQLPPGRPLAVGGLASSAQADIELELAAGGSQAVAVVLQPFTGGFDAGLSGRHRGGEQSAGEGSMELVGEINQHWPAYER
jgi:hypothetical protein